MHAYGDGDEVLTLSGDGATWCLPILPVYPSGRRVCLVGAELVRVLEGYPVMCMFATCHAASTVLLHVPAVKLPK
jgi:hypothetical protein